MPIDAFGGQSMYWMVHQIELASQLILEKVGNAAYTAADHDCQTFAKELLVRLR